MIMPFSMKTVEISENIFKRLEKIYIIEIGNIL